MKSGRKSNFELLRIISMSGIIALHYVNSGLGGVVQNYVFPDFSWFFTNFVNSFFIPLVNCFVLISAYFLVHTTKLSFRKSFDLMIMTAFYGVLSYIISVMLQGDAIAVRDLFFAAVPFFKGSRWFVETYMILILIAPFLNKMLLSIDRKSYQILLGVQILIFSVWYSIGLSSPVLDDGYGIINFITLYLIGAYIRLHGKESKWLQMKRWKYLAIYAVSSMITFGLSYFINPFGYAFITNILGAAAIFVFFEKLSIGTNKIVNRISQVSFDVYFVHSDQYTSHLLIYEFLKGKMVSDRIWMIPHLVFVILAVWIMGFVFYHVRKVVFKYSADKCLDKISGINQRYEL